MISGRSLRGKRGEPAPGGFRLAHAELGQRHVDVAHVDVDLVRPGFVGGVPGDIALALAVPDQPQPFGPILAHWLLLGWKKAPAPRLCPYSAASKVSAPPRSTETSRLTPFSIMVTP